MIKKIDLDKPKDRLRFIGIPALSFFSAFMFLLLLDGNTVEIIGASWVLISAFFLARNLIKLVEHYKKPFDEIFKN